MPVAFSTMLPPEPAPPVVADAFAPSARTVPSMTTPFAAVSHSHPPPAAPIETCAPRHLSGLPGDNTGLRPSEHQPRRPNAEAVYMPDPCAWSPQNCTLLPDAEGAHDSKEPKAAPTQHWRKPPKPALDPPGASTILSGGDGAVTAETIGSGKLDAYTVDSTPRLMSPLAMTDTAAATTLALPVIENPRSVRSNAQGNCGSGQPTVPPPAITSDDVGSPL